MIVNECQLSVYGVGIYILWEDPDVLNLVYAN